MTEGPKVEQGKGSLAWEWVASLMTTHEDPTGTPPTDDELTCYAINTYGGGRRPFATPSCLDARTPPLASGPRAFPLDYIATCLIALRDDMMEDTSGQIDRLISHYKGGSR